MDDYGKVCHLDVQKTGSNYVSHFLRTHLTLPRIKYVRHGRIFDDYDPNKFYFITCRDPLDQYLSLFFYGCDGNGGLFRRLCRHGQSGLYVRSPEGFSNWLRFVLKPENAYLLREGYQRANTALFGFQTFRFLALSFCRPMEIIERFNSIDDVLVSYKINNIANKVIKNEHLSSGLCELARTDIRDHIKNVDEVLAYLTRDIAINVSNRDDKKTAYKVAPELLAELQQREWFMFEVLNYKKYV